MRVVEAELEGAEGAAIERGEKAGSFPRGGGQGVMTVDYWAREEG